MYHTTDLSTDQSPYPQFKQFDHNGRAYRLTSITPKSHVLRDLDSNDIRNFHSLTDMWAVLKTEAPKEPAEIPPPPVMDYERAMPGDTCARCHNAPGEYSFPDQDAKYCFGCICTVHHDNQAAPIQLAEWSVTTTEQEKARYARQREPLRLPSGPVITIYPNPDRYLQYVGEFLSAVSRYFDAVREIRSARSYGPMTDAAWARTCAMDEVGKAALDIVNSQLYPRSYALAGD